LSFFSFCHFGLFSAKLTSQIQIFFYVYQTFFKLLALFQVLTLFLVFIVFPGGIALHYYLYLVLFLLINFDLNPAFCCRKIKKETFFNFPGTIWEIAPGRGLLGHFSA